MKTNINYEGKKVAYLELAEHEYAHVITIDGEHASITDSGLLVLKFLTGANRPRCAELADVYETVKPALWNFVYEKDGDFVDGCHVRTDIPVVLYPSVDGEAA